MFQSVATPDQTDVLSISRSHTTTTTNRIMKHRYVPGDQIEIVAGIYKKHARGTYLGPSGLLSASVKVIGDTREKRNLRLSSIRPVMKDWAADDDDDGDDVVLTKQEYVSLLEEISCLSDSLKKLQLKVERLG